MRVRRDPFWPGDAVTEWTERPERLWLGRPTKGDAGWVPSTYLRVSAALWMPSGQLL